MVLTADIIGFGTMAVCLIGILGFVLAQNWKQSKARESIYKRLDHDRIYTANTYVRKDIHDTKYEVMEDDIREIKSDIKKLLGKSGIK